MRHLAEGIFTPFNGDDFMILLPKPAPVGFAFIGGRQIEAFGREEARTIGFIVGSGGVG